MQNPALTWSLPIWLKVQSYAFATGKLVSFLLGVAGMFRAFLPPSLLFPGMLFYPNYILQGHGCYQLATPQ